MGVLIDLGRARAALAEAGAATTSLLRSVPDPGLPVPGLEWTVRQTATHLAAALAGFAASAGGQAVALPPGLPGQASRRRLVELNARAVREAPDAPSEELADRIEQGVSAFLAATADRPGNDDVPMPWYGDEQSLDLETATCVLLGEQVVHGYDIARAVQKPWPIDPAHARLVIGGCMAMMPLLVNAGRTAYVRAGYDLAIWNGPRFTIRIEDGTVSIQTPSSEPRPRQDHGVGPQALAGVEAQEPLPGPVGTCRAGVASGWAGVELRSSVTIRLGTTPSSTPS